MTIEIHQPELEALIQERMATGRFHDVEALLVSALKSTESSAHDESVPSLVDALAKARVLLEGEELDLSRPFSSGRPIDLA